MLKDVFSFDQSYSCASDVFDSSNSIDTISPSMKRSNEFLQLIENLSKTNFSDEESLIKAKEIVKDADLTVPQWKKITSTLIDFLIFNKSRQSTSEPSDENEQQKKSAFALKVEKKLPRKNIKQKRKINKDFSITIDDDFDDKISQNGGGLWGKGEEQLVPFEIGMKILNDDINVNDGLIGEETKQKIKKIENDAYRMAYMRMNDNPDYQRLFHEKEHWKYLAKTRLIELENEIDFRYQLVFGDSKKKYL